VRAAASLLGALRSDLAQPLPARFCLPRHHLAARPSVRPFIHGHRPPSIPSRRPRALCSSWSSRSQLLAVEAPLLAASCSHLRRARSVLLFLRARSSLLVNALAPARCAPCSLLSRTLAWILLCRPARLCSSLCTSPMAVCSSSLGPCARRTSARHLLLAPAARVELFYCAREVPCSLRRVELPRRVSLFRAGCRLRADSWLS
jgi:hypothetical protein